MGLKGLKQSGIRKCGLGPLWSDSARFLLEPGILFSISRSLSCNVIVKGDAMKDGEKWDLGPDLEVAADDWEREQEARLIAEELVDERGNLLNSCDALRILDGVA